MTKHTDLRTIDHISVAIHAFFILFSIKLALTNHLFLSIFGWVLTYFNFKSFDIYASWRKNDTRK
jgi:hypothetical protein